MFSNNDYYNLGEAEKTLLENKMMLHLYIQLETLKQYLTQQGAIDELGMQACENYVRTLPHIKCAIENVEQSEAQIKEYKANPNQHLKDLFNAKLNGQL